MDIEGSGRCTHRVAINLLCLIGLLFSLSAFAADTTPPTAPSALTATATSGTQINLSWTKSTDSVGVTGYRIERCSGASCSTFAQIGTTTTALTFNNTGLTNATVYRYRVRANDAAGNLSSYSSIATATTPDTAAPTAPTTLVGSVVSSTQINLTWMASTDNVSVTGYKVERCSGASCTNFTQIATSTTTTFSNTGLTASTTYRYRVRANDAVGNLSGYSGIANGATQPPPDTSSPTAPLNLAANPVSSTRIDLNWTASTDNVGVTGYLLERCQGASCATFAQIGTPTITSYSDTGLTASINYSYRVRAKDAANNLSNYSSTTSAATPAPPDTTPPSAPSLSATAVSSSQINLSWTTSTDDVGITNYLIERCAGASCTSFSQLVALLGTTFSDTGVVPSTVYSYRIRATDAANNLSGYSTTATVTTQTYVGPVTYTYSYDLLGRITQMISSTGQIVTYQYDANGNMTVVDSH